MERLGGASHRSVARGFEERLDLTEEHRCMVAADINVIDMSDQNLRLD
jgi:hypothetical protein